MTEELISKQLPESRHFIYSFGGAGVCTYLIYFSTRDFSKAAKVTISHSNSANVYISVHSQFVSLLCKCDLKRQEETMSH